MAATSQTLVVPDELRGIAIADFLRRSFPAVSHLALRGLLAEGRVRVNGSPVLADRRLRGGDVVQAESTGLRSAPASAPVRLALPVLYESDAALVIDKPAGQVTVPDRSGTEAGIHGELAGLRPNADLRIVHRLDRDTTGCLLLAKGLEGARHFDRAFRDHAVKKSYLALVLGELRGKRMVEAPIGADPARAGKMAIVRGAAGKNALTEIEPERRFGGFTLVRLRPHTGRTHQLRVHLASIGHPIAGDVDYGGPRLLLSQIKRDYKQRVGVVERPLLERMFLHAAEIVFPELTGDTSSVAAPLPPALTLVLDKLDRFAPARRQACD